MVMTVYVLLRYCILCDLMRSMTSLMQHYFALALDRCTGKPAFSGTPKHAKFDAMCNSSFTLSQLTFLLRLYC